VWLGSGPAPCVAGIGLCVQARLALPLALSDPLSPYPCPLSVLCTPLPLPLPLPAPAPPCPQLEAFLRQRLLDDRTADTQILSALSAWPELSSMQVGPLPLRRVPPSAQSTTSSAGRCESPKSPAPARR
jgi:hypothetical protein